MFSISELLKPLLPCLRHAFSGAVKFTVYKALGFVFFAFLSDVPLEAKKKIWTVTMKIQELPCQRGRIFGRAIYTASSGLKPRALGPPREEVFFNGMRMEVMSF